MRLSGFTSERISLPNFRPCCAERTANAVVADGAGEDDFVAGCYV